MSSHGNLKPGKWRFLHHNRIYLNLLFHIALRYCFLLFPLLSSPPPRLLLLLKSILPTRRQESRRQDKHILLSTLYPQQLAWCLVQRVLDKSVIHQRPCGSPSHGSPFNRVNSHLLETGFSLKCSILFFTFSLPSPLFSLSCQLGYKASIFYKWSKEEEMRKQNLKYK